jgi:hypothetical protein
MGRPCPAHRPTPTPVLGAGEQQLNLTVIVAADPVIEVAGAEVLLLALEGLRNAGVVVHHIRLHIDGRNGERTATSRGS